jgi:ATP-binding protein involved in chromosome partitioning
MANIRITEQEILKALSKVQEPELRQDLVSLKMIRDIKINGKGVQFTIMLTTPACPLKAKIEAEARQAVMELGASTVEIRMDSSVRGDGMTRGLLPLPVRNVIAIASGKGGVGKSTVAVNMAVTLAQSGARVGLLDADIYGPNIPTMMGVDRLPPPNGNRLIPAEVYGVKLMSIGFLVKPGQPLIWRGPMLHSAIRQFLGDVEWGELDYLVVDLPPGTGDAQLSLSQSIPLSGGVLVTMPQQVSLEDASRSLAMFRELKVPVLGVVENMSYLTLPDGSRLEVFGNGGGEQLARMGGVDLMGKIPMDPAVRAGGDEGRPIVISDPESEAARVMRSVAEQTAAKLSVAAFQAEENAVGKAV